MKIAIYPEGWSQKFLTQLFVELASELGHEVVAPEKADLILFEMRDVNLERAAGAVLTFDVPVCLVKVGNTGEAVAVSEFEKKLQAYKVRLRDKASKLTAMYFARGTEDFQQEASMILALFKKSCAPAFRIVVHWAGVVQTGIWTNFFNDGNTFYSSTRQNDFQLDDTAAHAANNALRFLYRDELKVLSKMKISVFFKGTTTPQMFPATEVLHGLMRSPNIG